MRKFRDRVELVRNLPAGRAMELGVFLGDFSQVILTVPIKELWLVDCWCPYPNANPLEPAVFNEQDGKETYLKVVSRFADDPRVRIVRGYIEEVLPLFRENTFDWIYVDADHQFHSVYRHLELAFPLVKPGGFLCGHDYLDSDFYPWLKDVKPAVDMFCEDYGLKIAYITEDEYPSYAIQKPFK
ncbi:MAG: class I SAM-dependent methyltransferase [Candidatus Caldarchaeum sp.]